MAGKVAVVGSLNMDLVIQVPRRPSKGETLRGTNFAMFVGGKGNNQALAAARAGAEVSLIGRVGQDVFGDTLLATLEKNQVKAEFVGRDNAVGTGVASIMVDAEGDNSIVIAAQANDRLSPQEVEQAAGVIEAAKVLLVQLEIPLETVLAAARIARKAGVMVALNPAPAPSGGVLPPELLAEVDLFIPNQTEAQAITKLEVQDEASAIIAARALQKLGPPKIIITMGEMGALVLDGSSLPRLVPSFPVKVVDTTAAGDAFCGAMAAQLAQGKSLEDAVRFGCAAGALAATKAGAEPSLPYEAAIRQLIESK